MTNADHEIEDFIRCALDARRTLDEVLPREQQERERCIDGTFRVHCATCLRSVSNPLPFPAVIRALVLCPECAAFFPHARNTQDERQVPMSPMYLGQAVSDEYMQGLIEGYRDGQRLAEHAVEDGDAPIITRLTEESIKTERGAVVLGYRDSQGKGVEE